MLFNSTIRGELVEPPASQLEPFDKLTTNGNLSKVNSLGSGGVFFQNCLSALFFRLMPKGKPTASQVNS